MSSRARAAVRTAVIVGGGVVALASLLSFRLDDWAIYVVFLLVSLILFLPYVEVLPTVALPIPEMAATIGFLYIGGLPIVTLRNLAPILTRALRSVVPERWKQRLPQLRSQASAVRRELFSEGWGADAA